MTSRDTRKRTAAVVGALGLMLASPTIQADAELLAGKCGACHQPGDDGAISRISDQRKTPEGWDMTLARMQIAQGVQLSGAERGKLVKYLADTYGLAPKESASQRAILERRPGFIESPPDADLAVMCGRCHTWGRVALQRRTESEWLKHVHFHVGQYPTIEYQAMARDRDWFDDAVNNVVPALAKMLPLQTEEWQTWQEKKPVSPIGKWVVSGHRVGEGAFTGSLFVYGTGDQYSLSLFIEDATGNRSSLTGQAIVYTGYEWRARIGKGDRTQLQVMAISEDGMSMSGRWFDEANDSLGGQVTAIRADAAAQVVGTVPAYLQIGASTAVKIVGAGLDPQKLLPGMTVEDLRINDDGTVAWATVTVPPNTKVGPVKLGEHASLMLYRSVDSVRVEPAEAIARVGGNGGPIAAVPAQFDAVGFTNGPDGKPGTDDDLRIGPMPAQWSVEPFDEVAKHDKDVQFAGRIDAATGLFSPAGAGPNPRRRFGTNNVGNLKIVANVKNGDKQLQGSGHLIVTVQRFNDPPIR